MSRRLAILVALAAALSIGGGAVAFRLELAEGVILRQAAALGVPAPRLAVTEWDLGHLTVAAIAAGTEDEIAVEALTVRYRPGALLQGRLDAVEVIRPRVALDLAGGAVLGSLQPLVAGKDGGGDGGLAIVADRVTVQAGRATVATAAGAVTVDLNIDATEDRAVVAATARDESGGLALDLVATVAAPLAAPVLDLRVTARAETAAWPVQGSLDATLAGPLTKGGPLPLGAPPEAWLGGAALAGTARGTLDGGAVGSATLDWALHLDGERGGTRLRLSGPITLALAALPGPLAARLDDGVVTALPGPDGPVLSHAVTLSADALSLDAPQTVHAQTVVVRADGTLRPGAPYHGQVSVSGERVRVPSFDVTADGVTLSTALPALAQAAFQVTHLRHPLLAPVRVEGTATRADGGLAVAAAVLDAVGRQLVAIAGDHALADGHGSLRATVGPLVLGAGGVSPAALSPVLQGVRDAGGRVGGEARLAWSPRGLESGADVAIDGVSFTLDGVAVDGVDARLALDGLVPVSAAAAQTVTVRRIDPAVPLDDIALTFRIPTGPSPRLHLDRARAGFAGGTVTTTDAVFDPARPGQRMTVAVDGVDLGRLLALFKAEGVTATGLLDGTLPLTVADGKAAVAGGTLAARRGGVLQVRSQEAKSALGGAGEQVALMLSALEDFHYDTLSAAVDMAPDGETNLRVHMKGHNPAVLEGYPFAFNIALGTNMAKLLAALREGGRLSSDLLRPTLN